MLFENVAKQRIKQAAEHQSGRRSGMKKTERILIIDDEPSSLELLQRIFEGEGYQVVLAANGLEGVDLFRKSPCDLVITDIVMPGKDGLQTILDLRQEYPEIPFVAISGGGVISKERYLTVAGYLDRVTTLAKPYAVEAIVAAVEKLLAEGKSPSDR
jgi:CheY-like chemotaxis protein